ncbi:MAG: radical SAM protein [Deltaproteobacteria bacterium]|nr:radical SAM protein [Deltaproteobacteria bacterium]
MSNTNNERLQDFTRLAESLGTPIIKRGVLQHYFVSPVLPMEPLTLSKIADAWRRLAANIKAAKAPELLSLYIHIPFCTHKCKYCIYHSIGDFDPADLEAYLARLHAEIDFYSSIFEGIGFVTCYIGGGTPTVLDEEQLERLLSHIDKAFKRKRGGEWAFEGNPLTATESKARIFESHGFNRVSFGVQTLNSKALDNVNRGYQSTERVVETLKIMQACRLWVNVDLIHGLPQDSFESMALSLTKILEHDPTQVTVYGLSPYTPAEVRPSQLPSMEATVAHLKDLAEKTGYEINLLSTCFDLIKKSCNNRLEEEIRSAERGFVYDDTTVEPFSLLGIGPTARSYVYGQMRLTFDKYPVDSPFDPHVNCARGREITMDEERRRYIVHRLESSEGLRPVKYTEFFGEGLAGSFSQELQILFDLGLLREQAGSIVHVSDDPTVRFAAELFFVDPEMIDASRQDTKTEKSDSEGRPQLPQGSEELHRLRIEGPGIDLTLNIAEYWPDRPCFHYAGKYAFFIPSELPEGTCQHNPGEEWCLSSFRQLFDKVVESEAPNSLAELQNALLAGGTRHLFNAPPNQAPVPIILSATFE